MDAVDLRAERLNRGLTAAAAAKQMGLTHKNILLNAENGSRPYAENAFKIASFYGFKVTEVWPLEEAAA